MPVTASLLDQVRQASMWFADGCRTQLELAGADRAKFLHNFCTNDIKALPTGSSCEAFVTSVQGKILAHIWAHAEPSVLTISSLADVSSLLTKHLNKYHISEDLTITDQTANWGSVLICGPTAAEEIALTCQSLGAANDCVAPHVDHGHGRIGLTGGEVCVRRHDFLGGPTFELTGNSSVMVSIKTALAARIPQGDWELREFLRISAGFPLYGADLDDSNLAQEASRTSQAISFRKGCYLGQEPIARIDSMGHVNQLLRSVRLNSGESLPMGTELFADLQNGKPIGRVTSMAAGSDVEPSVAMVLVRREHQASGQVLAYNSPNGPQTATVFWNGPQ